MSAIFSFDEGEDFPHRRRDTVSSLNSFDDRWTKSLEEDESQTHRCASPSSSSQQEDILQPRFRHFGLKWDKSPLLEEEYSSVSRTGSPSIPIPKRSSSCSPSSISSDRYWSAEAEADELDGLKLNRKMVPSDFEHVKVLGKGGYARVGVFANGRYGTVLLVRHIHSGKLFAQKQLNKATVVVKKKIIGISHIWHHLTLEYTKSERMILEEVKNPFVVKLFYAFQDSNKLYLILEVPSPPTHPNCSTPREVSSFTTLTPNACSQRMSQHSMSRKFSSLSTHYIPKGLYTVT